MNIVRFALVGVSLVLLQGCASLVLVQGPQPVGHPDREASSTTCTTSKQWIAMDGIVGGALALTAVTALASGENSEGVSNFEDWVNLQPGPTAAVSGVLAGVALWSARRGSSRVNDCRDLRLQLGVAQQAARERWSSANRWNHPSLDIPAYRRHWSAPIRSQGGTEPLPWVGQKASAGRGTFLVGGLPMNARLRKMP